MHTAHLSDRAVAALSGEDAISFLQGVITTDARRLAKGEMLYALLLTPQGKFLHEFFLTPQDGKIFLDAEASRLPDLLARLKMYKLRSKVTIETLPEYHVIAQWENVSDLRPSALDPRHPLLGMRALTRTLPACNAALADYEKHRISLGVPDGHDLIPEKSFPMEFGLEHFAAIDFAKGCYVGQEVTARTKYRGHVKKGIFKVQSSAPLPPAGTPVVAGEGTLGELRSSAGRIGLALLRFEETQAAQAGGLEIRAGGHILRLEERVTFARD